MDTSKSKLQITSGKTPKAKLGASTSSKQAPSPLGAKKDYKKPGSQPADFGVPSFGLTGLEGQSK